MLESKDLIDFSITSWYETFKHICIETILIEIPPALLKKLKTDETHYEIEDVIKIYLVCFIFKYEVF